jgi:hypothetical protein
METCLPRINQYMMTAEINQNETKEENNYPFKKMNIWFEDFELKKPERLNSGSNSGIEALKLISDD